MSKRAEKAAMNAYPPTFSSGKKDAKRIQAERVDTHQPMRTLFIRAYEQAEKDLALTVEDVLLLMHIWTELPDLQFKTLEAIAEETLKRFNEQKNGL